MSPPRISTLLFCTCLAACASAGAPKLRAVADASSIAVAGDADYYKIGRKQLYDGHVALALEAFRMDWMRHGDSIRTLNGIAICYDMLGRHEIATAYFDRARQLDPASQITQANFAFSRSQFAARTQAAPVAADEEPKPRAVPLAQVERVSETEWQLSVPKPAVARERTAAPLPIMSASKETAAKLDATPEAPTMPSLAASTAFDAAATPTAAPGVSAAPPVAASPFGVAEKLAAVPTIRIVNGTGRTHMARRFATHLRSAGVSVKRLANAAHYDRKVTVIEYLPGSEQIAKQIAASLPVEVELREAKHKAASIEIVLGADLLEFDRSIQA